MNLKLIDRSGEFSPEDIQKSKIVCGISYLWILFFLPVVAIPESKFGRFHANQSLLLLFANIIISFVLSMVVNIINFITFSLLSPLTGLVVGLVNCVFFVLIIICLLTAVAGKAYELPIIGGIRIIK